MSIAPDRETNQGNLSAHELKAKGRELMRQAQQAMAQAEEVREQSTIYSKAGKDLQRQIFHVQLIAGNLEAAGDAAGARDQRKVMEHLKGLSEKNFRFADEKGQEAAELERKAFRARAIALKIADQVREITANSAG